jgi:two-component system, LuxR family, sensor kinase FixL
MNRLLKRQMEKYLGSVPTVPPELAPLFQAIGDAYDGFETDRRLIERSLDISSAELTETNERLRRANQELNEFAYVASHDLKAPLRGIKTLADWIAADGAEQLSADAREHLRLLQHRIERMHNLIDGILQYSRVGRTKEVMVPVNLGELIPEIVMVLDVPAGLTITVQEDLPVIDCDRTRITQVFQNLLSNAIKFMDKPAGHIEVGWDGTDTLWTFHVADNGPGIEEKYHEKIFQLFQTLSPRDEFESTGVGLTLVKRIVEMYGGRVWIESRCGEGSTFYFTWPRNHGEMQHERLQTSTAC